MTLETNREEELILDYSRKPPRVKHRKPAQFFLILSNGKKSLKVSKWGFGEKLKMSYFAVRTIFGLESPL